MFGDPRELILKDIHSYTAETVAPFGLGMAGGKFVAGYCKFPGEDPGTDTIYLAMSHGERVLFYGMDLEPPHVSDLFRLVASHPEVEEEEEEEESEDITEAVAGSSPIPRVTLFCRRHECENPFEVAALLDADDDYVIDSLEHVRPTDSESNEDFFLRNAMWLLNPTVH